MRNTRERSLKIGQNANCIAERCCGIGARVWREELILDVNIPLRSLNGTAHGLEWRNRSIGADERVVAFSRVSWRESTGHLHENAAGVRGERQRSGRQWNCRARVRVESVEECLVYVVSCWSLDLGVHVMESPKGAVTIRIEP